MARRQKTYQIEADRLDELLERIEREMGPSAVLERKDFKRGGFLGLGGRRFVEIIATLEVELDEIEQDALPAASADIAAEAQDEVEALPDPVPAETVAPADEPAAQQGDLPRGPLYQPPMPVRPVQQAMPVALDEVDSLAYALGKLAEHAGSVDDFFAQGVGGHNISRAAAARAKSVHGLDVEAELAALEAVESARLGQADSVAPPPSPSAPVASTPEERYLAAQALMGSGVADVPFSAAPEEQPDAASFASEGAEQEAMEDGFGWTADAPAEPVIETVDEFSVIEDAEEEPAAEPADLMAAVPDEADLAEDEFEDDDLLASGAGLAMDLAADHPSAALQDAERDDEPSSQVQLEADTTATAGDAGLFQQLAAPAEPEITDEAADIEMPSAEPEPADVTISAAPVQEEPSAPAPLATIPPEVLRFMEEMKQAMNGLQTKVQELSDVRSQVADVAAEAAAKAAHAAIERLLVEEGRRRAEDDERRRVDQQRYEEEISALRAAAEKVSAAAERGPAEVSVANPLQLDVALNFNAVQRQVYDMLLDWNIGHYDALELLNVAIARLEPGSQPSFDGLIAAVSDEICRNVLLGEGIRLNRTPPGKAVALVGPTGVGKTTTIAKLAAHFAFQQGKRVSLVSMDNYRIAAAEQLRTYADIMGLDLDIVFSKDEFDKVLSRRRSSDLILIDTAGRSPNNVKHLQELREIFSVHPPDEVHLVLNAGTRRDDMRLILDAFKPLSYDHLIVSKLDETRSLGALYNLTRSCTLPISYFAVGQSVPEDIRTATLPFIKQWIAQGRIL